jgi:hypothetical protein
MSCCDLPRYARAGEVKTCLKFVGFGLSYAGMKNWLRQLARRFCAHTGCTHTDHSAELITLRAENRSLYGRNSRLKRSNDRNFFLFQKLSRQRSFAWPLEGAAPPPELEPIVVHIDENARVKDLEYRLHKSKEVHRIREQRLISLLRQHIYAIQGLRERLKS